MSDTVPKLIDDLGGVGRVADAISSSVKTVSAWKSRKGIPVDHWPKIIRLAAEKKMAGVNADALLEMHSDPDPARQPASDTGAAE